MKIRIIQIGKTKNDYVLEGMEEFVKRLKPFASLEFLTLKEIATSKAFSREKAVAEEGKEILKALTAGSKSENQCLVILDEKGKEMTSVEFAGFLGKYADMGKTVNFVIGGPFGLSEEVRNLAKTSGNASLLAISKMTFTHQMVRLFLLEQIYRGVSILKGKEYHNL